MATVSAGWAHTCVVTTGHLARCWGAGSAGRLGYGNTTTIGDNEPASAAPPLSGITFVDQLSASNSHTCSTHANGIIYCWGYGGDGRLGFGNTFNIGDVQQPGGILGLNRNDANFGTHVFDIGSHTGTQAAAANCHKNGVDIFACLTQYLDGNSALPGNHIGVVEGMDIG